jgi:predicted transcriptional regulator
MEEKMKGESLSPIDKLIVNTLKSVKKPQSTYRIAKDAELSWSTVNSHCYKLKSMGYLDSKVQTSKFGGKTLFWKIKKIRGS